MVAKVAKFAWIFLVLALAFSSVANGTPPSCVSLLVKWKPLVEIVSQYGTTNAVKQFRRIENSFTRKTYCPTKVPAEWQDIRPGMLYEGLRELVAPWLRQGNPNIVSALFKDINQAKIIRSFENLYGKNSRWTGCAEVSLQLQTSKGMYMISMDHIYHCWEKCPVKFNKKSANRKSSSSIFYTGVPAQ